MLWAEFFLEAAAITLLLDAHIRLMALPSKHANDDAADDDCGDGEVSLQAPEVIMRGIIKAANHWALGMLILEMLAMLLV